MAEERGSIVHNENEDIQMGEISSLSSTYEVDFISSVCWKVWQPMECKIRLKALDSCFQDGDPLGKSNLSVVLHVKCSKDYPGRKPQIQLQEPRGLSKEDVQNLLNQLNQIADENEGQVVTLLLCARVREFLADHNSNPPSKSFHDDMLANKAKTEAEQQRNTERIRLNTEQKELELLEEEMRQRNADEIEKTLDGIRPEVETKTIGGRRIVVLTNIPVKRSKPWHSCHEWMGFWENSQLLISEWTFRYYRAKQLKDFDPFIQKFDSVYNDIKKLCEIRNLDQNLVEYAFVHQEKISLVQDSIILQLIVAQKLTPNEENLEDTYELVVPKSNLLRLLAAQAICGLRSLHEASMTHKNLTRGCVWTRNITGDCVFRFSDFGSMGPLISLAKMFSDICSGKYVPNEGDQEKEHEKRRKDLFQLGTLLDRLVVDFKNCGSSYSRATPPHPNANSGTNGTNLLSKFIIKCQEAKNIDQLVEDPFLKEDCHSESENLFTTFGGAMNPAGRMLADNVIIRILGKGGFGDVVLVRNKMDSTDYAIKRIPLNSAGEKVNRKIAKEAKFFAKLNHPNMVRYFNAWAEDLIAIPDTTSDDDSYMGAVPIPGKEKGDRKKLKTGKSLEEKNDQLGGGDSLIPLNLRALAQDSITEAKEWSAGPKCNSRNRKAGSSKVLSPSTGLKDLSEVSSEFEDGESDADFNVDWDAESEGGEEEEDDSSDDSEDDDSKDLQTKGSTGTDSVFERSLNTKSDEDDDVVFTGDSENGGVKQDDSRKLGETKSRSKEFESLNVVRNPRILCIQMEYCDRQTLRQYIDEMQCFNNPTEVWRIFSEILCGLKYMHNIQMIHRDIKPLNIFLTSNGGVKIGDFGLATLDAMSSKGKIIVSTADKSASFEAVLSPNGTRSKESEVQQTRDIGTQLYMAPELFVDDTIQSSHRPYTSKIDIYSAGVVLFEMFYLPLKPGMERVSTLNNLREKIEIPPSFGDGLQPSMSVLARKTVEKMLQKNPDKRPTAEELLNDEDLPMHSKEDAVFRTLSQKIIKKRDGREYQSLLNQQFKEDVPRHLNYRYDNDICLERYKNNYREAIVENLRAEFCNVFKIHSFEKVHTHTLIPVSTALASASVRTKPVEFLDRKGIPVALPMDLRQNFVRYCVRNAIQRLKRFNFGRIYNVDAKSLHPNEKWECCVDSIGPQSSSTSLEAELLLVACELISKSLPGMKITLKIGHSQLLEAQIRHLKLSDDARTELLEAMHIISLSDRAHSQKEKMDLLTPKIGSKAAHIITRLLIPVENNFIAFKEKVGIFRKSLKDEAAKGLVDKAIGDLEKVIELFKFCRTEDLEKISINYDSQACYRPRTFGDGLVFQIQVEKSTSSQNKQGRIQTVLAGGRYDSALLRERHPRDFVYDNALCICGFGCAIDTLAQLREHYSKSKKSTTSTKVLICSLVQPDGSNLIKEKFTIVKQLWSMNIAADVFHAAVDDIESLNEHRIRAEITHILAVYNPDMDIVYRTETANELINLETAIQNICRGSQLLSDQTIQMSPINGPIPSTSASGEQCHYEDIYCTTPTCASKSGSTSQVTNLRFTSASLSNVNIIFAVTNDKYHKLKEKKRAEASVRNHLQDFVSQFSAKSKIEVLLCDIPVEVIKKIVGEISKTSTDYEIDTVFDQLLHQHGKLDLTPVRRHLKSILHSPSTGLHQAGQLVILFYRVTDNFYRCLT
ncbi:unnamed protein product [Caenorhabditis brenneri]